MGRTKRKFKIKSCEDYCSYMDDEELIGLIRDFA